MTERYLSRNPILAKMQADRADGLLQKWLEHNLRLDDRRPRHEIVFTFDDTESSAPLVLSEEEVLPFGWQPIDTDLGVFE